MISKSNDNSFVILEKITHPKDIKKLSKKELKQLTEEIRYCISKTVRENGGHLGPNLGAVELILGCHLVFDLQKDKLIFDVGHQCYAHKILTGRYQQFTTLRKKDGISGYPHQEESPFDVFRSGHASTSISTSLGILEGFKKLKKKSKSIALIGDGSMTGGMAFEAMNHTGYLNRDLIVLFNDNSMSISKTVGALSKNLHKFRHQGYYLELKKQFINIIGKLPKIGSNLEKITKDFLKKTENLVSPKQIFINLGFDYLGPIDGNNIVEVQAALKMAKRLSSPVIIHALTQKGKGFKDEGRYGKDSIGPHALSPKKKEPTSTVTVSYSKSFTNSLIKIANKNKKVVAITAAMLDGTGLIEFQKKYPNRCYDVGICEAHSTGFSAGLSSVGIQPIFAVYSTFLQRAFDQIFHDIILQKNLPVIFCIDRAGLVGDDGPSHHGIYDIAYLRIFPQIILMAPKSGEELEQMLVFALQIKKTVAIRYPRGNVPIENFYKKKQNSIQHGKGEIVFQGEKVCLFAYGQMVYNSYLAAMELKKQNKNVTVVNARFAKPIDENLLLKMYKTHDKIIVLEEGTCIGGLGSGVLEIINQKGLDNTKIQLLAIPDKLIEHASREEQLQECGLDVASICRSVLKNW